MRSPQQACKLKQVGNAYSHGTNSKTSRTPNHSDTGFLLLDTALKPLYVNPQAAEILFPPEKPAKSRDFADDLALKVRAMVINGGAPGRIPVCGELLSCD